MAKQSETEFLRSMATVGFEVTPIEFAPGTRFVDHSHDFESCILITQGLLAITTNRVESILTPGDVYQLDREQVHSEVVGDGGVSYLSARPRS
jgi:quercetin dioxygenase-like cupin family protein